MDNAAWLINANNRTNSVEVGYGSGWSIYQPVGAYYGLNWYFTEVNGTTGNIDPDDLPGGDLFQALAYQTVNDGDAPAIAGVYFYDNDTEYEQWLVVTDYAITGSSHTNYLQGEVCCTADGSELGNGTGNTMTGYYQPYGTSTWQPWTSQSLSANSPL
jgi:hypothetical protein